MRRRALSLVVTTLVAAGCGSPTARQDSSDAPGATRYRIAQNNAVAAQAQLAAAGFSPDHGRDGDFVFGFLRDEDAARLPDALRDQLEKAPEPEITPELREGYHDHRALTAELQRLADAYPSLIRLESAGKSVQGRDLWYVVMSDNVTADEHEPKFIYHANMHGDEVVGRELMIYLIRHLAENYGRDPRITQILSNVELFVMPSMNPDGYELGRRENARGYDLNRNFPDRFSSPRDTPDGRQLEVQHMIRLNDANHFVFGMNWHGGEICFNLPWGNIRNNRPENMYGDDALFNPIGREYTELNRSMYANHQDNFDHGLTYGYEWYPVNGGINDWFNYYRRSVHAVVELTVTKWPSASTLQRHWDDNREAMLTYLWRGLHGIHLEIRDAAGQLVTQPTVTVASAPKRPLTYDTGWVHRLTTKGSQTVTIEAPGFAAKTITVDSSDLDGTYTPVILERR